MSAQVAPRRASSAARQRGQTIFLAAVLLLFGISAVIYTTMSSTSVSIANRQAESTARTLAQAKEALIGRSASDGNRPGSLPCPDTDDDGVAEIFVGSNCPSYIGRLPWRTLGLPDPRDASAERLWYMLSTRFRDHSAAEPINSDSKGDVMVYVGNGSTELTNEAVAIIFAPGAVIGNQVRDTANKNNAANYLESASGINNASAAGPYISAQLTATFNDRLLVITTADLMTRVEQRVARELRSALQAYKANSVCGCYPWADISDGTSQSDLNRGRVPTTALPEDWGSGTIPNLPGWVAPGQLGWFVNNSWRLVIYYSVGRNFLQAGGGACDSCVSPNLSVDGVSGKEVAIIMPGPVGVGSESAVVAPHTNWPFNYFEDPQNNDHSNTKSGNDLYVTPSSKAYSRDRIFTIP